MICVLVLVDASVLQGMPIEQSITHEINRMLEFFNVRVQDYCDKTPKTLQTDFINSCKYLKYTSTFCSDAWEKFSGAFSGKDPVAVKARFVCILLNTIIANLFFFFGNSKF